MFFVVYACATAWALDWSTSALVEHDSALTATSREVVGVGVDVVDGSELTLFVEKRSTLTHSTKYEVTSNRYVCMSPGCGAMAQPAVNATVPFDGDAIQFPRWWASLEDARTTPAGAPFNELHVNRSQVGCAFQVTAYHQEASFDLSTSTTSTQDIWPCQKNLIEDYSGDHPYYKPPMERISGDLWTCHTEQFGVFGFPQAHCSSKPVGGAWTYNTATYADPGVGGDYAPWVASGSAGPRVVYLRQVGATGEVRYDDPNDAIAPITLNSNSAYNYYRSPQLAVRAGATAQFAIWEVDLTTTSNALKFARCTSGCTSATNWVDTAGFTGADDVVLGALIRHPAAAYSADGRQFIAYTRQNANGTWYVALKHRCQGSGVPWYQVAEEQLDLVDTQFGLSQLMNEGTPTMTVDNTRHEVYVAFVRGTVPVSPTLGFVTGGDAMLARASFPTCN